MAICERGTMMSRTCSSTTCNTPSSISCASGSMMPRSRACPSTSVRSSRSRGSPLSEPVIRRNQLPV
jgi:hypothetical protein